MEANRNSTPSAARLNSTRPAALHAKTEAQGAEREMLVVIRPYKLGFWQFEGTRAQIESEGAIPAETEWPEGTQWKRWEAGRFRWHLRRIRPDGLKGPKRLWTSGDWWSLRCELLNGPDTMTLRILDMRRELADELYWQSAAGRLRRAVNWRRYWTACEDEAFQAFKAKIPGLVPPKRSRKPKQVAAPTPTNGV